MLQFVRTKDTTEFSWLEESEKERESDADEKLAPGRPLSIVASAVGVDKQKTS